MISRSRAKLSVATITSIVITTGSTVYAIPQINNITYAGTAKPLARDNVVHLVYWNLWGGDWEKTIQKIVDDFNRTHPNIQVQCVSVPDVGGAAETKLLTSVSAGDPPDVMTEWNNVIPSWASKGAILNLTPYISSYAPGLKSWLYPVVNQIGEYNGHLYEVPWMNNSFMLFYNKDMMKSAGLDPNKPPKNIAELDAMQAKEWKIDNRGFVQQMGFVPSNLIFWAPAFNGHLSDDKGNPTPLNPNIVKEAQWFQSYEKKYNPSKVSAFLARFNGANGVASADPFVAGKLGFAQNGMWEQLTLKQYAPNLHYGVVPFPFPAGYGKSNATWVNGGYNVIPKGSKHPKEAFQFIVWLAGYGREAEAAKMYTLGGWIPPSPKIAAEPYYQQWEKEMPYRKGFVDIFSSPNDQVTPVIPIQQYYSDQLGLAEQEIMTGKQNPIQALQQVKTNVFKELTKK